MKIVVDALGLPRFGGARSSVVGWLAALATHGPDHRYWIFVSRPEPELMNFRNLQLLVAPFQDRFLVRIWAQAMLPPFLSRVGADVFHATKNLGIVGVPCPTVITVNDLTHVMLAEYYPWSDNLYWKCIQPLILRKAARIIAISESTRQGLIDFYGLDGGKIQVIYPCYHPRYRRTASASERAAVHKRYDLPDSYILYVGGLGLHKNVRVLVDSFEAIANQLPHGLVLVGGHYHTSSDQGLLREIVSRGRARRVWLLNNVPEEHMPAIYQMADLFVLPSLNEGFGLTLIEAMISGVPVIAGRVGAIPEVVGNAGYLLDNIRDQQTLAKAMLALINSPMERALLAEQGQQRASLFSWEKTAYQTLSIYNDIAK